MEGRSAQINAANLQKLIPDEESALLREAALRHGADENAATGGPHGGNCDPERLALPLLIDVDGASDADLRSEGKIALYSLAQIAS